MADDPHPEFRCVCISWTTTDGGALDPYERRCPERPSQEDQLCDHCRRTCQRERTAQTVPLLTPCRDLSDLAEVPF